MQAGPAESPGQDAAHVKRRAVRRISVRSAALHFKELKK